MNGFDATIISQYQSAPSLAQLVTNMNGYIDPSADIDNFYSIIWNVDTAVEFGLDIWGKIVGVSRILQVASGEITFGFTNANPGSAVPFNQGAFYTGAQVTNSFALSDDAYRVLIFAKALSNICDGSIPALNQILLNLFPGRGNCYVTDGLNLTMAFHFTFTLTPVELAIVSQSGVLAKPAGVASSIT